MAEGISYPHQQGKLNNEIDTQKEKPTSVHLNTDPNAIRFFLN